MMVNHIFFCRDALTLIERHGWKLGLQEIFSIIPWECASYLASALRERLLGCKFFLKLRGKYALVVDKGLGMAADALTPFFERVILLDSCLTKAKLFKIRCREEDKIGEAVQYNLFENLPFRSNSFDAVLLFLHSNSRISREKNHQFWGEVARVLKPDGRIVFVGRKSTSSNKLKKQLASKEVYFLGSGGKELVETIKYTGCGTIKDRPIFCLQNVPAILKKVVYPFFCRNQIIAGTLQDGRVSTLSKIVQELSEELKGNLEIRRILFLGSTILELRDSSNDRIGFIVRVPCDERSRKRCKRNFRALQDYYPALQRSGIVIPRAICQKTHNGLEIFVEEWLPGKAVDNASGDYDALVEKAVGLCISLFNLPKENLSYSQWKETMEYLLIRRFSSFCPKELKSNIHKLKVHLLNAYDSMCKYNCLCHGDFKLENILFQKNLEVSGIIDWDLFMPVGPPFLDLLHLLFRRRAVFEGYSPSQFMRECLWRNSWDDFECKMIAKYSKETGVPTSLLPVSYAIYWLHFVTFRIGNPFLKMHPEWKREYVEYHFDPVLSMLRNTLSPAAG